MVLCRLERDGYEMRITLTRSDAVGRGWDGACPAETLISSLLSQSPGQETLQHTFVYEFADSFT